MFFFLLYLVKNFVVDFFNDLTGMDNMAKRLWDLQSKGAHNVGPKAIGGELVTLFKNYMSEFTFEAYILFVSSVSGEFRTDPSLTVFGIDNVKDSAIKLVKDGLIEEGKKKTYIDATNLTDENIDWFLKSVVFVIDEGTPPSEYVKAYFEAGYSMRQHDAFFISALFKEKMPVEKIISWVDTFPLPMFLDDIKHE